MGLDGSRHFLARAEFDRWCVFEGRCHVKMAHVRQSRPDFGLGFRVKILQTFRAVPSSLGSGLSDTSPATC